MKSSTYFRPSPRGHSFRVFLLLGLLFPAPERYLHAQQPAVTIASNTGASIGISADTYRASRTPTVTLTIGAPAKGSFAAKVARLAQVAAGDDPSPTPSLLKPQSRTGIFDEVNLGYLGASSQSVSPVNVTLQFDVSRAGTGIWVQPLDGGTILSQDIDGNPVSSPAGYTVTLDPSGQLTFGYQALSRPGRYQVLIRMDNVSTILPFIIPDPSQDN